VRGCRQAQRRILRHVDHSLPLEERFLLDEHLGLCSECEDLYERSLAVEEALVRLPEPPEGRVDVEAAVRAIRRAVDEGCDTPRTTTLPWRRAAAVAAGFLGLVALGAWLVRDGSDTSDRSEAELARSEQAAEPPVEPPAEPAIEVIAELEADAVIQAMRSHLLASLDEDWDPASSPAVDLVGRFEGRARELHLWPLPRIAEKLLDDPDPRVACAAARYLGLRGDQLSAFRLEDSFRRRDVAAAAVRALGDLGPRGVPVLAQALQDPELAPGALVELQRIGGPDAAGAIERRLLTSPGPMSGSDEMLDALAATGPAAVASLIKLAQHGSFADANPLLWLKDVEGGGNELARLLRAGSARQPVELLLQAVAVLQPKGLPLEAQLWVEERVQELRVRERALQSLVLWEGTAPLESLLRLDAEGRVPDDDLLWALEALAGRDVQRLTEYARELLLAGDAITAGRYLELLLVSGDPRLAPALGPFVHSDLLSDGERQLAALAIGEVGAEEDALLLLRGLEHLGPHDERLFAACLITVHRVLGEPGVTRATSGLSPGATRQVRMALDEVGTGAAGAIGLSRVARALDGALAKQPKNRNPIL